MFVTITKYLRRLTWKEKRFVRLTVWRFRGLCLVMAFLPLGSEGSTMCPVGVDRECVCVCEREKVNVSVKVCESMYM